MISTHVLALGVFGRPPAGTGLGAQLQDVSVQLSGNVDNYFVGHVALDLTNLTDIKIANEFVREAYAKTTAVPVINFKMGKFLANFGKNNMVYPHAQQMIDRPLIVQDLFGTGMSSVGLEADIIIPTPWFFNLSFAVLNAQLATSTFNSAADNTAAFVGRMEHDFKVTDAANFGFGVSTAIGDNNAGKNNTYVGGDVTFKFAADTSKDSFAIAWMNEFILRSVGTAGDSASTYGFFTNPMLRFHPKFWAGARFDLEKQDTLTVTGESVMLAYVPSDTSALRFQGGFKQRNSGGDSNWALMIQYNMTIGSHPAHAL